MAYPQIDGVSTWHSANISIDPMALVPQISKSGNTLLLWRITSLLGVGVRGTIVLVFPAAYLRSDKSPPVWMGAELPFAREFQKRTAAHTVYETGWRGIGFAFVSGATNIGIWQPTRNRPI